MLRGLDVRGGEGGAETIIRVAGRDPIEGGVTAYVDASASDADAHRERLRAEFDQLEAAGVVADATVLDWQDVDAAARYDEFADAVGADSLEPHFESLADGNALEVPQLCITVRDADGVLTGLYPRSVDGSEATVEDGLRALRTGEGVANVEPTHDISVESFQNGDDESAGEGGESAGEDDESAGDDVESPGRVAKAD